MGHLDQQRKNIQSTKLPKDDHNHMTTPSPLEKGLSTHAMYAATICYNEPTGKLYTNLTRQFPVQSSRGHKYILVAYNFDSNSIHVKPLKSRHDHDTIKAYEDIYNMLSRRGLKPRLHWLDNEASKALKNFINKEQTEYQLTPPHIHRRNTAEQAIRTFKNHFISGLCSVDKNFPLHLWCRLLDQAELTLNMSRTSRINPNLSAHEQINGTHDFNATPLAPPGTRCIAHEKSSQRGTWAPHGQPGWYIGAAPEHYRCYQIYILKTQGTRICDTVEFFPTHCKMPKVSTHDAAIYAGNDLITALTKPQPPNSFLLLGDDQMVALQLLATIFQRAVTKKPTSDAGVPDLLPPPPHNSHEHAVKQNIWRMQPSPYHNLTRSAMTNRNRPTTPNKTSTWSRTPQMTCPPFPGITSFH